MVLTISEQIYGRHLPYHDAEQQYIDGNHLGYKKSQSVMRQPRGSYSATKEALVMRSSLEAPKG